MIKNDNTSNMATADTEHRAAYHHGDLRQTLIREGLQMFDSGLDIEDISLRALARSAGVSATAVYRHFPDKAALFRALALAGLDRMAEMQAVAMAQAKANGASKIEIFAASGGAYIRFALANPELFRLIWQKAPDSDRMRMPAEDTHPAMQALRQNIQAVMPADATPEQQRIIAVKSWGVVHGIAMLALDKQIVLDDALIDAIIRADYMGIPLG